MAAVSRERHGVPLKVSLVLVQDVLFRQRQGQGALEQKQE